MKTLLVIFLIGFFMLGCNRQVEEQAAPQKSSISPDLPGDNGLKKYNKSKLDKNSNDYKIGVCLGNVSEIFSEFKISIEKYNEKTKEIFNNNLNRYIPLAKNMSECAKKSNDLDSCYENYSQGDAELLVGFLEGNLLIQSQLAVDKNPKEKRFILLAETICGEVN